jgi:hypothetical protein
MKRKIILGVMIAFAIASITLFAKSQKGISPDFLDIRQFDLTITGRAPSPKNTLLLDESSFLKKFGRPSKISIDSSEMEEAKMTHYTYNGAEVWYMNNVLQAMSISSPKYCFQLLKGSSIKVGDNISAVIRMFPGSWAAKQFADQVFVTLGNKTGPVDMSLLFQYNLTTNLITGISVQE